MRSWKLDAILVLFLVCLLPIQHVSATCDFCIHGDCKKHDAGITTCECHDGWSGDLCSISCNRNCSIGTCYVAMNKEHCSCPAPYTAKSNCTEKVIKENSTSEPNIPVPNIPVPIFIFSIVLSIVLICSIPLFVYMMWRKRNLFFMKFVYYLQKYEDETDGKIYDVFVSYKSSESDESWVVNTLFPKIENEMELKVCVHFRDFVVGETISNNIINSIEKSRRTILVLSPSYINGEWTRMEYQVAQHEMLKLRHKIIPILFQNIGEVKNVDKNLKYILQTITYIEWPSDSSNSHMQDKFWEKLRLTLPKKRETSGT